MSYPANPPRIPRPRPLSLTGAVGATLRRSPGLAVLFLSAGAGHALSHGAVAWCAALLGRSIAAGAPESAGFGALSPLQIALVGVAAVLLKALTGTLATLSQCRLAAQTALSMQGLAVEAVLERGLLARSPVATARLVSRVREIERAVQDGVFTQMRSAAQLVPIAIALWLLEPTLALVAAAMLAPFAFALGWARKHLRRTHAEWMQAADALHAELDDLVRHAELWRTYGTGRHITQVVDELGHRAARARTRSDTLSTALSSLNEVLAALALVLAIFTTTRWFPGAAPNLVAFAAVFFMAYRPLRDLGDARAVLVRGQEATRALEEIARTLPSEPPSSPAPSQLAPPHDSPAELQKLVVQELRVEGRLSPVSFQVNPGAFVVVAGPTGAGKTTLLRSLLGLEPDAEGSITFGARSLEGVAVGPTARPFAWVPQDAPVISGSLDDNFRVAGADQVSGMAGLALLGASDLTEAIADVKVGAMGRDLSGGERRWIALARALATRLPVLLLDEPTVGLDPIAKGRVIDALVRLRGKRSMVCVSHDPDVLAAADSVVGVPEVYKPQSAMRTSVK